jgi:hypothetical protein
MRLLRYRLQGELFSIQADPEDEEQAIEDIQSWGGTDIQSSECEYSIARVTYVRESK